MSLTEETSFSLIFLNSPERGVHILNGTVSLTGLQKVVGELKNLKNKSLSSFNTMVYKSLK